MILTRVNLSNSSAYSWFIVPHDHKDAFTNKAHSLICLNYFHMSETLLVGTYLILTLDNKNSVIP